MMKKKMKTHSKLNVKGFSFNKMMYEFYNVFFCINFSTSKLVKKCVNNILSNLKLNNFTFIHIRRGDFYIMKQLRLPMEHIHILHLNL